VNQVLIFASVHVFTLATSPCGFLLLKLMRSYLELDMFALLTVHTEDTLAEMKLEFRTFDTLLQVRQFSYLFYG